MLDGKTLEWAARWITDSLKGETSKRVIQFASNMAMTLRAAAAPVAAPAPVEAILEERAEKLANEFMASGYDTEVLLTGLIVAHSEGYQKGRAAERERCAGTAEAKWDEWGKEAEKMYAEGDRENALIRMGWSNGASAVAATIREGSNQ